MNVANLCFEQQINMRDLIRVSFADIINSNCSCPWLNEKDVLFCVISISFVHLSMWRIIMILQAVHSYSANGPTCFDYCHYIQLIHDPTPYSTVNIG